jgi:lysozyme
MALTITDISHWQGKVDFVKMKAAGASGVIMKASQATFEDSSFVENMAGAKAAGLIRGAYHYLDWTKTGQEQADYYCKLIAADPPEIPPIIDYEEGASIPYNHLDHLQDFVSRVEELTGRIPMIYTGLGFWKPQGSTDAYWARFPLWVANWYVTQPAVPLPWISWVFWQYTPKGDGKVYGVESLQIDLNQYAGTLDDLKKFCSITPPTPVLTLEERVARLETWARGVGYKL